MKFKKSRYPVGIWDGASMSVVLGVLCYMQLKIPIPLIIFLIVAFLGIHVYAYQVYKYYRYATAAIFSIWWGVFGFYMYLWFVNDGPHHLQKYYLWPVSISLTTFIMSVYAHHVEFKNLYNSESILHESVWKKFIEIVYNKQALFGVMVSAMILVSIQYFVMYQIEKKIPELDGWNQNILATDPTLLAAPNSTKIVGRIGFGNDPQKVKEAVRKLKHRGKFAYVEFNDDFIFYIYDKSYKGGWVDTTEIISNKEAHGIE